MSINETNPSIIINDEQTDITDWPFNIQSFTFTVLNHLNLLVDYIEITCLPEPLIQQLNDQYFNVNEPTDTISFNLTPNDPITGDIYLCPSIIQKNAAMYNTSFETELKTVIIHSILHLTGDTDDTDEGFRAMQTKQQLILTAIES